MRCQSYFPSYNSHYDLNMDSNGVVRPIYNGNGIFHYGHCNNHVSSLSVAQFLRQTILMHEATFRDQVKELHRLYGRQKQLMGEIRSKELHMNHLQIGPQFTDSFSAKFGQNITVSGNVGTSNNMPDRESTGRKIGRKFLDLELPAEEYIDIEEGECLEDLPRAPSSTGLSLNMLSKAVVVTAPIMAAGANEWSDSVLQGDSPSPNLLGRTKANLADLNEPLTASNLEGRIPEGIGSGPEVSGRNHDPFNNGVAGSKGTFGETSGVQVLSRFNNHLVDASLRSFRSRCLESESQESVVAVPSVTSDPLKHVNGLNHLDLNSSVIESSEFTSSDTSCSKVLKEVDVDGKEVMSLSHEDVGSLRQSKKSRLIDINLPHDPTMEEEQPIIEDDIEHGHNSPSQINLNLSMNGDGLPPKSSFFDKTSLEIDLEAPPSPEVEECPPPRGDSEETQPEAPLEVSTPEDVSDAVEELVKNAAKAIVSIASSTSQVCPEKCEPSDTGPLEWFANLVHALSSDLVADLGIPSCGDTHILDEYEVMTLNLTEMKVEEYWCQNTVQIKTTSYSMPLPGQSRKGRSRRSKRKDFQREVLPSLASLSRYEVTEDIQMIEGLMEAAGTPWHLSRTRRACRMGRRATKPECVTFDKPETELKCEDLMGWGKANRRPRGQRSPASPSTVLSKWLEYVI